MRDGSNAPVIIKRKKIIAGGGHHGGAWKVAMGLVLSLWRFAPVWFREPQIFCVLKRHSDEDGRASLAWPALLAMPNSRPIRIEDFLNLRSANTKNLSEIRLSFPGRCCGLQPLLFGLTDHISPVHLAHAAVPPRAPLLLPHL